MRVLSVPEYSLLTQELAREYPTSEKYGFYPKRYAILGVENQNEALDLLRLHYPEVCSESAELGFDGEGCLLFRRNRKGWGTLGRIFPCETSRSTISFANSGRGNVLAIEVLDERNEINRPNWNVVKRILNSSENS